jgi:hypothetical protein
VAHRDPARYQRQIPPMQLLAGGHKNAAGGPGWVKGIITRCVLSVKGQMGRTMGQGRGK